MIEEHAQIASSSSTQNSQARVAPEPAQAALPRWVYRARDYVSVTLLRIARWADDHPALSFLALLIVVIPAALRHSNNRALWHDELFTFYISQKPTIAEMLRANRLIDLIPPLSFFLTRASYAVFHVNTLSTRLPEMLGFLLAMVSLFLFVRHRISTVYGLLAATLLYTGAAGQYSGEARPYGLFLGFGALSLLAWQRALERRRFALPLMLLAGFGMVLSHVFAIYIWGALAFAECVRIVRRRRVDWTLIAAWTLPLLGVITWIPLLRTHHEAIYPPAFEPNMESLKFFYTMWTRQEIFLVLATGLILLLIAGRRSLKPSARWFLSTSEWVVSFILLIVPIVLMIQLLRSHGAFFVRYGISATLAISIVATVVLAFWTRSDPRAALICVVLALGVTGELRFAAGAWIHRYAFKSTQPKIDPCGPCAVSAQIDPTLPLVDASGLVFVEMSNRESAATLDRLYYLTDPAASRKYAHANIFEAMALEKQLFGLRGTVAGYPEFVAQHHHFFVLGYYAYPEDWLLRKLAADGANLQFLGDYQSSYEYGENELYEVTIEPGAKPRPIAPASGE